jgi:hypothetical protein
MENVRVREARQDENATCEEYGRRIDALLCDEEYLKAVREEIERSNCTNKFYGPDPEVFRDPVFTYDYTDTHPCAVFDEVDDKKVACSEGCANNQFAYLYCKYLGEDLAQLFRECGPAEYLKDLCSYNDKGFCGAEPFIYLPTVYNECFKANNTKFNGTILIANCSDACKEALEFLKSEEGCCTNIYFVYVLLIYNSDAGNVTLSEKLFSDCGIEIPERCETFPATEGFRECAGDRKDGDVHVSPTIFCSAILIMLSFFSAM